MSFEEVFDAYLKGITDMHLSNTRLISISPLYQYANFVEIPLINNDLKTSVENYAKQKYIECYKKDNLPMGSLQITLIDDNTFKTYIKDWLIDTMLEENSPYRNLFKNPYYVDINQEVTKDKSINIESVWEKEIEFEKGILNWGEDTRLYINHYHTLISNEILEFLKNNLGKNIELYSLNDIDMTNEVTYIGEFFDIWACNTFLIYNQKKLYYLELCECD